MIVPGSNYWNMGLGLDKGDVEKDSAGIETMKTLGRNMAWLIEKITGCPSLRLLGIAPDFEIVLVGKVEQNRGRK